MSAIQFIPPKVEQMQSAVRAIRNYIIHTLKCMVSESGDVPCVCFAIRRLSGEAVFGLM